MRNKWNKTLSVTLIGVLLLLSACRGGSSSSDAIEDIDDYYNDAITDESGYVEDISVIEPTIEESYAITRALTDFSERRAWVEYSDYDGNTRYGVIDTNGFLLFSIPNSELAIASVTIFEDGLSCVHSSNESDAGGMVIVNKMGVPVFDSRSEDEGVMWYYLGYGDGTFLAIKNVTDFSKNETYICEIDESGNIVSSVSFQNAFRQIAGLNERFESDFSYCGSDIFIGTQLHHSFAHTRWIYNRRDHYFYRMFDKFVSQDSLGVRDIIYGDWDGEAWAVEADVVEIISDEEVLCRNLDDQYFMMTVDMLLNTEDEYMLVDHICPTLDVHKSYQLYGDKVFNNIRNMVYGENDCGTYDYRGELIAFYPKNWEVVNTEKYRNGLAAFELKGADGNTYVTVADHNFNTLYDPLKVDTVSFPSWHGYVSVTIDGEDAIIDANGNMIGQEQLYAIGDDVSIGSIVIKNGWQRIRKASEDYDAYINADGTILSQVCYVSNYEDLPEDYDYFSQYGNSYSDEINNETIDKDYVTMSGFSIEGKWKNTGEDTYGQAQAGTIIVFDGSHCNFFSPRDTYAFYESGDSYKLDCTSPLADTVSFTVKIVDENNIDIFFAGGIVEMTRIE